MNLTNMELTMRRKKFKFGKFGDETTMAWGTLGGNPHIFALVLKEFFTHIS